MRTGLTSGYGGGSSTYSGSDDDDDDDDDGGSTYSGGYRSYSSGGSSSSSSSSSSSDDDDDDDTYVGRSATPDEVDSDTSSSDDYSWSGNDDDDDDDDDSSSSSSNDDNSTNSGLWGGIKNTAKNVKDAASTTASTARDTAKETAGVATGDTSALTAANSAGETLVNAATGGDAQEWRDEFRSQEGDIDETAEKVEDDLDNGGFLNKVGAANQAVKVGLDAGLDNPRGVNVQDAGTDAGKALTGSDDKEELAKKAQSGWESATDAIDSADERLGVEGSTTAKVAGTGFEWFVEDPAKAGVTAATGIDPETGDTESRAEPVDLVDYAFLGGGKAIKGASKAGSRLLKGGSKADEVASTATKSTDNAASGADGASSSGGLRQAAAAGVVGTAAALGGPKAAKSMSKFSWLDDALKAGSSGADEAAAGADDVAQGIDSGSLSTIDNFDGLSSSVGTGDDAFKYTEDLSDTASTFDGAADDVGGSATSIDDVVATQKAGDDSFKLVDEAGSATDDVASGVDDAASNLPKTFDEVGGVVDDTAGRLSKTFDDTFRAGDDLASGTDDTAGFFSRTVDNLSAGADDLTSAGDDLLSGTDDAGSTLKTADDTGGALKTADEGGSLADDIGGGVSGIDDITGAVGRWFGRRGWTFKLGAGIIGLSVADDLFGIPFVPDTGDRRDPGPQGQERYRAEPVKSYEQTGASLYEIQQGSESAEWKTMGHGIVIGKDEEGTFVSAGSVAVVGPDGRPTTLDPVSGDSDNAVPQARFSSVGQADDAHAAFLAWLKDKYGDQNGEQDTPEPDDAPGLDGSLSVPSQVTQGEPFSAEWSASLTGEVQEMAARLTLGISTPDGLVPIAESDFALGGARQSASGTFEAPSGWPAIAPGEYDVHAVIQQDGEILGAIASDSTEVKAEDEGDKTKEGSAWGDPELVQELPMGWYLYAQVKEDGSKETRFMVVGVREDEVYLYLHGDGRARQEPFFFPTAEDAAAAFRSYMERDPGADERPSEGASRPDNSKLKKDAAAADEKGAMGLLNKAIGAASSNPVLFAGGTAATLVVGYYLWTNGYMDKVIQT